MKLFLLCVLAFASALFAQDQRHVTEPVIPPVCVKLSAELTAQGASLAAADESKLDTARIQHAIDTCAAGHAVELKASGAHNAFLTAPLQLRSNVTLLVAAHTTLFGSRNPRDYDLTPGSCGIVNQKGRGCRAMINGDHAINAGVMGDGTIDGRGEEHLLGQNVSWWDLAQEAKVKKENQNCPRILVLTNCDNFTLYRITLKNSPNFHVSYRNGSGFTAWGVIINTPKTARNTDGIDPGNSTNVTITHCYIHAGDDNVAIKAGSGAPTTHMTISHNHFYTGHGMSIGSETNGGASEILVTDLSIDGADNGLRIKSNASRGGLVHGVVYQDVCIRNTKNPIYMDSDYEHVGRGGPLVPKFTGITFRNIRIEGAGKLTFDGYDAEHRLGMTFDNVTLADPGAIRMTANHADFAFGPGPVNFRPTGEDVNVTGAPGEGSANACSGKFVPLPSR
ncbi:MAG TPA: glycosyl hydrolase family 28 protein [Bryobacteraceae bacterium]|nr:glycosyl hydrolase family 28 protein [Bryobacteraceae bacterium]